MASREPAWSTWNHRYITMIAWAVVSSNCYSAKTAPFVQGTYLRGVELYRSQARAGVDQELPHRDQLELIRVVLRAEGVPVPELPGPSFQPEVTISKMQILVGYALEDLGLRHRLKPEVLIENALSVDWLLLPESSP